jgi:hypothetical protein
LSFDRKLNPYQHQPPLFLLTNSTFEIIICSTATEAAAAGAFSVMLALLPL